MSLSPPSTFLCVAGSCTVVDKNAHTFGTIQKITRALWQILPQKTAITNIQYLLIEQSAPECKTKGETKNQLSLRASEPALYTSLNPKVKS